MLYGNDPAVISEVEPVMQNAGRKFEFIALSISGYDSGALLCLEPNHPSDQYDELLEMKHLNLTYYDKTGLGLYPVPIVNVMFIGLRDGIIAHRISLGWILFTKWIKAERQFKLIGLE